MFFSKKARLRRLEPATGIADWAGYKTFRQKIWDFFSHLILVEIYGLENIPAPEGEPRGLDYYPDPYPRDGDSIIDTHPYILVPNHRSTFDIPAIGAMKRPKAIVGKAPFAMAPFLGPLFFLRGLVTIRRRKDFSSKLKWLLWLPGWLMVKWRLAVTYTPSEMWEVCEAALHRGIPVEIYGTGSRTDTDTKLGPFVLACRSGVPILPVAISGCKARDRDGNRDKSMITKVGPIRRKVVVVIGKPIMPPYIGHERVPDEVLERMKADWEREVYEKLLPEADKLRKRV